MKELKKIILIISLSIAMLSFSQCSSTKKLQDKAPVTVGKVYFQKWVAGIKGGGSGLNIFIPVSDTSIILDSVYFRGRSAKLEIKPQDKLLYIGRFISPFNQKEDMIMSGDSIAEFGNRLPVIQEKIPFELEANECIVSYKDGNKTKYFKIQDVVEKAMIPYPSRPNNQNK